MGPVSCQYRGSCLPTQSGSGAVPKLSPDAESIPKREEASLLGVSLTGRSKTPQTVGPICTPIMGEEASLLGVLA